MQKYGLESFELSQAYLFFWDKFEKANWFLEQIIDTSQDDIESRVVQQLFADQISDGGQMSMVQGLVAKYGLVPKGIYPDNWNAMNSGVLNSILKTKLRQNALTLRKLLRGELAVEPLPAMVEGYKARFLQEVLMIMTLLLGPPPSSTESFIWEYNDKNGEAHRLSTSPKAFARDIYGSAIHVNSETLGGMISLVHDPRHKPMSLLTVDRLGNIVGGRKVEYVNVDMETLKFACVRMIQAGMPIFFGCDVGQFSDKDLGVMDTDLLTIKSVLTPICWE
ncbi:peptidase C1B-like protein [Cordyceps fumosorosea ARSEF 2679]|uniref:Peptidase C1B-like protein n=1 Tax=Cordyceps fumosorosea (strain ARSEF 2679) TaxID=1081104 RepID=A0A168D3T6_CORFA|nr:peptidase C1B-like protein [Cordyceps fumosorosea ARSEF 2679]OAA72137.1 peptidase C1B-like protein [Cordyceps fumosorosea ARSEF 2679]